MTIDGERTRDFDDALSLEEVPDGWRLGIHIADVSALVQPHNSLDREAQERGTSIYLPEHRLPMLPEEISEDTVSLLARQERLALSFLVTLSADARDPGLGNRPQPDYGAAAPDLPRSGRRSWPRTGSSPPCPG